METKLAPEKPDYVAVELKEIERLRRVEQQHEKLKKAARDFVDGPRYTTWDDKELVRVRGNFAKLKAALDNG